TVVLDNDYSTRVLGSTFNSHETDVSMWGQRLFFVLVLPLTIACCAHLYADDLLWVKLFYIINPAHRYKAKARWLQWIKVLDNNAPGWGILIHGGELVFCDSVFGMTWRLPIDSSDVKEGPPSKKKGSRYRVLLDERIRSFREERRVRESLKKK